MPYSVARSKLQLYILTRWVYNLVVWCDFLDSSSSKELMRQIAIPFKPTESVLAHLHSTVVTLIWLNNLASESKGLPLSCYHPVNPSLPLLRVKHTYRYRT